MSSSIKAGMQNLLTNESDLAAVVITLCDQPHVGPRDLERLIETYKIHHPPVVAARYANTRGVPALFSRDMFASLLRLDGDKGAKRLINEQNGAITVEMNAAEIDIDTLIDAQNLMSGT